MDKYHSTILKYKRPNVLVTRIQNQLKILNGFVYDESKETLYLKVFFVERLTWGNSLLFTV